MFGWCQLGVLLYFLNSTAHMRKDNVPYACAGDMLSRQSGFWLDIHAIMTSANQKCHMNNI